MAADCATRACALAIATAACVGLPGALVYAIVRIAAARRFGATFALSVVLVFWVTVSAAYYPRICADLVPWSDLARRLRRSCSLFVRRPRGGGAASSAELPLSAAAERQGGHGGMRTLPREPPAARGGARVAALQASCGAARAADGEAAASRRCAVCLCDVEKEEAATWLPACLHMFHQHCIDQWLHLHGHSTCPICRCDAFVAPLPELTTV